MALAWAETLGSVDLFIGVNVLDASGYPDCRPEFMRAFTEAARLGTQCGAAGRPLQVLAPLQEMSKIEILRLARELGVPVERTFSCYDPSPGGAACGGCDACRLRARALAGLSA